MVPQSHRQTENISPAIPQINCGPQLTFREIIHKSTMAC